MGGMTHVHPIPGTETGWGSPWRHHWKAYPGGTAQVTACDFCVFMPSVMGFATTHENVTGNTQKGTDLPQPFNGGALGICSVLL